MGRDALGLATRPRIVGLILGDGAASLVAGVLLGLLGAWAVTRVLAGLVYGISVRDPWSFGAAALVLLLVGLTASWIPARRAAGLSVVRALRSD